jgi:hypothetical protein
MRSCRLDVSITWVSLCPISRKRSRTTGNWGFWPATLHGLAAAGVELIDREPRTGLHGWRIAFIHPRSCAGVLTELVERASTEDDH